MAKQLQRAPFHHTEALEVSWLIHVHQLDGLGYICEDLGRIWVLVCEPRGMVEGYTWKPAGKRSEVEAWARTWGHGMEEAGGHTCLIENDTAPELWICHCPECVRIQLEVHETDGSWPWGKLDDREALAERYGLESEL